MIIIALIILVLHQVEHFLQFQQLFILIRDLSMTELQFILVLEAESTIILKAVVKDTFQSKFSKLLEINYQKFQ